MGYSMGAGATLFAVYGKPQILAAAAPFSPIPGFGSPYAPSDEQMKVFDGVELPIMFQVSGNDLAATFNHNPDGISVMYQEQIDRFFTVNGLSAIGEYDFVKYPVNGYKADMVISTTLNNEYGNTIWYSNNAEGIPMVALDYTEFLPHGLYQEYAKLSWDFMKHYSRDLETGAVKYNPYTK